MESRGSKPRPNVHMVLHIRLELCIHGELDESFHIPICYAETCGSSNWYNPLSENILPTVQTFPILKAMATPLESQLSVDEHKFAQNSILQKLFQKDKEQVHEY